MNNWTCSAACRHTTAPISYTRPSTRSPYSFPIPQRVGAELTWAHRRLATCSRLLANGPQWDTNPRPESYESDTLTTRPLTPINIIITIIINITVIIIIIIIIYQQYTLRQKQRYIAVWTTNWAHKLSPARVWLIHHIIMSELWNLGCVSTMTTIAHALCMHETHGSLSSCMMVNRFTAMFSDLVPHTRFFLWPLNFCMLFLFQS